MSNWENWNSRPPRKTRARTEWIDPFYARGMRLVYGRGDHMVYRHRFKFEMNIWCDRKGNLFARFSSQSNKVDDLSLAIHGIRPSSILERAKGDCFTDAWIPQVLRDEYERWMSEQIDEYHEWTDTRAADRISAGH